MEDPTNGDVTAEPADTPTPALPGDDRVRCPNCGQMNRPSAEFCWECAKPMSAGAPVSAGERRLLLESEKTVPVSAPAGELDVSTELPFSVETRRGFTTARVIGLVLFAAVAAWAAQKGLDAYRVETPNFPASIGGFSLLGDPASAQERTAFIANAKGGAGAMDTRFYGDDLGATQIQLISVKDPSASPLTVLTQAPFGFQESQVAPTTLADKTYYCTQTLPSGPFSLKWIPVGSSGGACAWTSGTYSWVLLSRATEVSPSDLANVTTVGRGVSAFFVIGLWTLLAVITAFAALRLVWASFFR